MAHTYGYARVSTTAQNLDAQVDALTGPGGVDVRDVVVEMASGRREDRPELARLLAGLREGDTLVVTKLDRLGRSAADPPSRFTERPAAGAGDLTNARGASGPGRLAAGVPPPRCRQPHRGGTGIP